jgi:Tol biopolymer transport system component
MQKAISVLMLTAIWLGCGGEQNRSASEGAAVVETVTQADTGFYQELSWSPDGSRLLISVLEVDQGPEDFTYRIYEINVDGSGFRRLTNGPRDYWTSWSPDGSQIVFAALRDGNYDIYVVDADGSNEVRLTDGA